MKQKEAMLLSMLVLTIVLVAAETHALLMPSVGHRSGGGGLKASVVETLDYLDLLGPNALPAVPGMRDVPELTIN
ncbi:MAG: hypothetical protein ABWY35_11965 [Pseudorhodoplanes sp.]